MMGLVKDLFYKGDYQAVLEKTYDNSQLSDTGHIHLVIGSLSFLGRVQEAEALYLAKRSGLAGAVPFYCRFFLAIGWTRRSSYQKAKKYLIINRRKANLLTDAGQESEEIKFLVAQGISFFLYFLGSFEKSLNWNQKSLTSSIASENFWMRALASDLLGNNLIQNGLIHEGLKQFDEAAKFAKKIDNVALASAIETSKLVLSSEYGINLTESNQTLIKLYEKTKVNDSFTKANLGLELARQMTLQGLWVKAQTVLNEIANFIFQSQNRRQEARYNLRFAELFFMKGEYQTALHFVRSGRRCLEHIDYTYEMQFIGIEKKILELGLQQSVPETLTSRMIELSQKFFNAKNDNILSREGIVSRAQSATGGDEIHQLLLRAKQNPRLARQTIISTGYFSWLYRFFELQRGKSYVLINLEPKSITILTPDEIVHRPKELSTISLKILMALSKKKMNKEELVQLVWGYQYDPLRHDSLIYSTFSGLRKIFPANARIIETTEMGYALNAELVNLVEDKNKSDDALTDVSEKLDSVNVRDLSKWIKHDLNSRQIQILQHLEGAQFVSVKNLVKMFKTSEITANRDLRSLFAKKLVVRVGRGRSTQYALSVQN